MQVVVYASCGLCKLWFMQVGVYASWGLDIRQYIGYNWLARHKVLSTNSYTTHIRDAKSQMSRNNKRVDAVQEDTLRSRERRRR
jgi:hypothetical protein